MTKIIMRPRGRPTSARKDIKVSLRIDDEMKKRLDYQASRSHLSLGEYIRYCIEEVLTKEEDRERFGYYD